MNAIEALDIVRKRAQWMREEGESDMRSILYLINGLMRDIESGKTTEQIMNEYADEEEE